MNTGSENHLHICGKCGWPHSACLCVQTGNLASGNLASATNVLPSRLPCHRCGRVDGTHGEACDATTKWVARSVPGPPVPFPVPEAPYMPQTVKGVGGEKVYVGERARFDVTEAKAQTLDKARQKLHNRELREDGRQESMRIFETGATRDTDEDKFDYEGFLHPRVLEAFAAYMHDHRQQADGSLRDSDNWQKGIPIEVYLKSLVRHIIDLWALEREHVTKQIKKEFPFESSTADTKIALASAVLFNIQGYLLGILRKGDE